MFDKLLYFTHVPFTMTHLLCFLSQNFQINVIRLTDSEMEFDMIGIDASIANAFRRILIGEVIFNEKALLIFFSFCVFMLLML